MKYYHLFAILGFWLLASCGGNPEEENNTPENQPETTVERIPTPNFSADSAYRYVEEQLAFGPRVPNTEGHRQCAEYLKNKLKNYGAEIEVQKTTVTAYDGTVLHIQNIIGKFAPENSDRLLLFAHWDTRPMADKCEDPARRADPIPGANDGASGVAVLLEIARLIGEKAPHLGIDIIFFDAEDYGDPESNDLNSWCLGSQYWAKNTHEPSYSARYGILLDMVGAPNAIFTRESYSMAFAPNIVDKVWNTASRLGYSSYFSFRQTRFVGTDDHVPVSQIAGIPSINIVQFDPSTEAFGKYWHTHNDNLDAVDRETLKAVGQTVLETIYNEH